MRALLALALLAACSQQSPEAELVERPQLERLTYICTPEGEEMIEYESELIATGRTCDYEAWREAVELYGPRHLPPDHQSYRDWLSSRDRGA